ncbi:MAG: ribosome biogenesis GTPase Der [Gammaproteobacteria bacterium]|nr:ribosome biogenesis GTPase Der [Gammaproteobacteria bacterium]
MKPVIALVGRPNVGKSTLFNKLTRSRDALVADLPGLTRDRQYGDGKVGERAFIVVDTGGLSGAKEALDVRMEQQTQLAISEANVVLFMVDARAGLMPADVNIADQLRRDGKSVFLVVNKVDGLDIEQAKSDFYSLGLGQSLAIAASHGRGVNRLIETVLDEQAEQEEIDEGQEAAERTLKVAVVGRPNVGKSTLINRFLGEERVVAFDRPGTTRDSVFIPFEKAGQAYTLIDTAGVRRRGKVKEVVEKFSVIKTLQAIDASNVVIMMMDASQGIADQDLSLLGYILDSGRALVVAINKWDDLSRDQKDQIKKDLDWRLGFLKFAKVHQVSAKRGTGVGKLLGSVNQAYRAAMKDLSTPELTRQLQQALLAHQPPLFRGRRIKLRYAHQGGVNPPLIVIHGNQTDSLPGVYKRYLANYFQEAFKLFGTPLRLEFRTAENPFAGRRTPPPKTKSSKELNRKPKLLAKQKARRR